MNIQIILRYFIVILACLIIFIFLKESRKKMPIILANNQNNYDFFIENASKNNINSIYNIDIWSKTDGKLLWSLVRRLDQYEPAIFDKIKYGVIPEKMRQEFPPNQKSPRNIGLNEILVVNLSYQYDSFFSAKINILTNGFIKLENGYKTVTLEAKDYNKPMQLD